MSLDVVIQTRETSESKNLYAGMLRPHVVQYSWYLGAKTGNMIWRRRLASLTFGVLALVFAALPHLPAHPNSIVLASPGEAFDPTLTSLDSLEAMDHALPHFVVVTGDPQKDLVNGITTLIEQRFVHGMAVDEWNQNWILNAIDWVRNAVERPTIEQVQSGAFMPYRFSGSVRADDILKQKAAFCSQQALVFQNMLARHGIEFKTVAFSTLHMASAAKVDGVWRLYDTDLEPGTQGADLSSLKTPGTLVKIYEKSPHPEVGELFDRAAQRDQIVFKWENTYPARWGSVFHVVTSWVSRWGWCLLMAVSVVLWYSDSRKQASFEHKERTQAYLPV